MFRNIPIVTKNLLIVNFLAFVATWVLQLREIDLASVFGLHFYMASDFHLYQFVTYMFLHANLTHIFFNMFALWMFGCVVENVWGAKKFLFYYISCGVGAGVMQELVQYANYTIEGLAAYQYVSVGGMQMATDAYINLWTTIGASGAVYGILLAFGMIFPNERIFIFPLPVPIKAKWFVMGYVAIELFSAVNSSGDGVAHMAHLGGMLSGFLLILYWRKHPGSYFNMNGTRQFFDRWGGKSRRPTGPTGNTGFSNNTGFTRSTPPSDDMEYNARQKARQEEIDKILDKIRKSGYDSLTKEEKQRLFEASHQR